MPKILLFLIFFVIITTSLSCSDGVVDESLEHADKIMEVAPDSALSILDKIEAHDLRTDAQKAKYALLKSIALDKNYIDTKDFSILQPAIDYYIEKGTPNQKVKTYYYQGRIYQNQDNEAMALESFINALGVDEGRVDSLIIARALVAQGSIFYSLFKINDFINNNKRASLIYKNLGRTDYEFSCLSNVFFILLRHYWAVLDFMSGKYFASF